MPTKTLCIADVIYIVDDNRVSQLQTSGNAAIAKSRIGIKVKNPTADFEVNGTINSTFDFSGVGAPDPTKGSVGSIYHRTDWNDEGYVYYKTPAGWQLLTKVSAHASTHNASGSDPIIIEKSQVTNLVSELAAKSPLDSPVFTGIPTAPTATVGDSTTQIATTAFVAASAQFNGLIKGSSSLTVGALAATAVTTLTFTISGLTTSHKIIIMPKDTFAYGVLLVGANVSATNTVSLSFSNSTGGSVTPGAVVFNYIAWT